MRVQIPSVERIVNKREEHFYIPMNLAADEIEDNSDNDHIVQLTAMLENEKEVLGVESFSVDCTSLEQIFMALVTEANGDFSTMRYSWLEKMGESRPPLLC